MEALGAEVVFHGSDFDEAREHCAERAGREGLRYIHSANEPHLIAGVGTITLEILEDAPDVTTIVVPVGGGSGAAGACLAAKTIDPKIQVIGVRPNERRPPTDRGNSASFSKIKWRPPQKDWRRGSPLS